MSDLTIVANPFSKLLLWPLACALFAGPTGTALAQEPRLEPDPEIDEIVTIGSRRAERTATDIPVAVDVIDSEALENQPYTSMLHMVRSQVPSFNSVPAPTGGTSSHTTPPNFRGMSPDHLLVLINGKRHHRSADIPTLGALVQGSQGVDIISIPAIAIKQLEVLRDGAAAQYGADAIAGVFNFVLNDDPEGGRVEAKYGQYTAGDGESYAVAGTYGVPLGDSGFVRISGEFGESDPTDRSALSLWSREMLEAGIPGALEQRGSSGNPTVKDNVKTVINMAVDVGSDSELYGFGSYHERSSWTKLFERRPWNKPGVFTTGNVLGDGIEYRLVGDLTPDDAEACPGTIAGGGLVPASVDGADDRALRDLLLQMPNCFSWYERLPAGYAVTFGADISDASGTLGFRGTTENGWDYDFSGGFGHSTLEFNISNVPSASFGSDTVPLAIDDIGGREYAERVFNADFSKGFEVGLNSPLNVATGLQWHREQYRVTLGDPLGWDLGPLADQGFAGGTDVYFGYGPRSVGEWNRHSRAVYVDLEADVTERLLLNLAGRHENFSDLGDDVIYKVAGRFQLTDWLAVRAARSTGFHAPTPAQQNFIYATTEIDGSGQPIEAGVIPATSTVAQQHFGAVAPVPENSESNSFGLIFDSDLVTVTLDYFEIDVENRITLSAHLPITDEQRQLLIEEGFTGADQFSTIAFFTNDFSTTTKGFDLVAVMPLDIGRGSTNLNFNINTTDTEVTARTNLTNENRVFELEQALPDTRGAVTATHTEDKFSFLTRVSYWGNSSVLFGFGQPVTLESGDAYLVDLEVSYRLTDAIEFSLGGANIFDKYPNDQYDKPLPNERGLRYVPQTPYGINGAQWYATVQYEF